jgi:hypothetical protein
MSTPLNPNLLAALELRVRFTAYCSPVCSGRTLSTILVVSNYLGNTGVVNRIVVPKIKIPIAVGAEGLEAAAAAAAAAAADQEQEVVII